MRGMHPRTGRALTGYAHLIQSIQRILTTPIASRVMRREFGCDLTNFIDAPNHAATHAPLYAAAATALMRWEPRLRVERVQVTLPTDATRPTLLQIDGVNLTGGTSLTTHIALGKGEAE